MPAPHTIIFDLGNVLIRWNPRLLYYKVFPTAAEADWFVDNIVDLDWNEEQDRGRPIAVATEELVQQHPKWEAEIRMYYDRFEEHFPGAIEENVALLRRLQSSKDPQSQPAKYRLLALTNWSAELFPWARKTYDFLDLFEDIMVSGEVKMKKPDPEIYELLRTTYDLGDFSGCVFIDDSLRNSVSARKCGLDTIRFEHPTQLVQELRARGVEEA
ncbi:MAG: HAD-IA family hydrolase [Bacteroidota bacterium]